AGLALAAAVCVWLTSGGTAGDEKTGPWQPILPADEYHKLVKNDAKVIQDALAKELDKTEEKKVMRKLKATALMIAVYTQSTGAKDAKQLAGVRDTALKLLKALENDNLPEA